MVIMMQDAIKAREELKEILNTREYQVYYHSKGFLETWWGHAKEWLAKQLAKLFPSLESVSSASGPILIIMIAAVVILLAWALFLLIRYGRRHRLLRKQKPLQSMNEIHWSSNRHLDEAKKQESLSEYSLSTRHLFLALLLYFHEKNWLEARIWKTNWDYYDELRKINQQDAGQFYRLAHFFDEVTYGERKVSKEEYVLFKQDVMKWLEERGEKSI
jgi:hypothetical protein